MSTTRRFLVIGAHPDDADLRFGGTAIRLSRAGHQVKFVSVANGCCGHQTQGGPALARRRYLEAQATKEFSGVCEYQVLDINDCEVTPSLKNRAAIIRLIRRFAPDVVLSHRLCDYHADHRNTAQLVLDAAYLVKVPQYLPDTPIPAQEPVFGYLWDAFTDPRPFRYDAVVPIDEVLEQKCRALNCHVSQFYEWLAYEAGLTPPARTPENWPQCYAFLRENWCERNVRVATAARELLERRYGAAAASTEYAEAFEYSPYGRKVTPEEFQALFDPKP